MEEGWCTGLEGDIFFEEKNNDIIKKNKCN